MRQNTIVLIAFFQKERMNTMEKIEERIIGCEV